MSALLPPGTLHTRLIAEHGKLDDLLDRLIAAYRTGDRGVAASSFAELEHHLEAHLAMEEQLLFPEFARFDLREADELRAEHRAIRSRMALLGVGVDLHLTRLPAIEDLALVLRRHASREDALLYRWADRELADPAHREALEQFFPPDPLPAAARAAATRPTTTAAEATTTTAAPARGAQDRPR